MEKIYFTALLPASNLEIKCKKILQKSSLYAPLPPMIPLQVYKNSIKKKEIDINIDLIPEFKTGNIKKIKKWWVLDIPKEPFNNFFPELSYKLFPTYNNYYLLLGIDLENNWIPQNIEPIVIRNWELGFFKMINWDTDNPFNNVELELQWKIKKRRLKQ